MMSRTKFFWGFGGIVALTIAIFLFSDPSDKNSEGQPDMVARHGASRGSNSGSGGAGAADLPGSVPPAGAPIATGNPPSGEVVTTAQPTSPIGQPTPALPSAAEGVKSSNNPNAGGARLPSGSVSQPQVTPSLNLNHGQRPNIPAGVLTPPPEPALAKTQTAPPVASVPAPSNNRANASPASGSNSPTTPRVDAEGTIPTQGAPTSTKAPRAARTNPIFGQEHRMPGSYDPAYGGADGGALRPPVHGAPAGEKKEITGRRGGLEVPEAYEQAQAPGPSFGFGEANVRQILIKKNIPFSDLETNNGAIFFKVTFESRTPQGDLTNWMQQSVFSGFNVASSLINSSGKNNTYRFILRPN